MDKLEAWVWGVLAFGLIIIVVSITVLFLIIGTCHTGEHYGWWSCHAGLNEGN